MIFKILEPYYKVCRVGSWLSWIFSFGVGSFILGLPMFDRVTIIFFAFSFTTASIFILNQYFDRKADKKNKVKSDLPIASEQISPRDALVFSSLLIILSFILVFMIDVSIWSLFIIYLGLWTAYSAPPTKLKSIPIIDFIVSGIGAGFLPFFIGLRTTYQMNASISFILLSAIPLILFHCGGHIVQAIEDYEADRDVGVNTFIVKYGKKKGVLTAGIMFSSAFLSPFIYSSLGFLSLSHLLLFFILLPFSIPSAIYFIDLYKSPSVSNINNMRKMARRYGILFLLIIWTYIFLIKNF